MYHHYSFFFAPNWITICAYPLCFWCFYNKVIILPGWLAAYFIFISNNYFFFIFSILFWLGPWPWNIADKYLKAYLGFISFPLAFRYSNFIRSPGSLWLLYLSFVRPNCYSLFNKFFYLRNWRVPAKPTADYFSSKKLIYCFIFSRSSGVIFSNESGKWSYSLLTVIFSLGKFTNRHEVVPLAASVML